MNSLWKILQELALVISDQFINCNIEEICYFFSIFLVRSSINIFYNPKLTLLSKN